MKFMMAATQGLQTDTVPEYRFGFAAICAVQTCPILKVVDDSARLSVNGILNSSTDVAIDKLYFEFTGTERQQNEQLLEYELGFAAKVAMQICPSLKVIDNSKKEVAESWGLTPLEADDIVQMESCDQRGSLNFSTVTDYDCIEGKPKSKSSNEAIEICENDLTFASKCEEREVVLYNNINKDHYCDTAREIRGETSKHTTSKTEETLKEVERDASRLEQSLEASKSKSEEQGFKIRASYCINQSFLGTSAQIADRSLKRGEKIMVMLPLVACMARPGSERYPRCDDKVLQTFRFELRKIVDNASGSLKRRCLCEQYCGGVCLPCSYVCVCEVQTSDANEGTGIYAFASSFGHSCSPNVEQCWDSEANCAIFVATKRIKRGEQLTVAYSNVLCDTRTRRIRVMEEFGFHCTCHLCSNTGVARRVSDIRREKIRLLDQNTGKAILCNEFEMVLEYAAMQIFLLKAEGMDTAKNLLRCEIDLGRANLRISRFEQSKHFLKLALQHSDEAYGASSMSSFELQRDAQDLAIRYAMFDSIA